MLYGPNISKYISKNPNSLAILEHVKTYAPELLHLFETGLDSKYFYADPVIKAKSIPHMIANTKTNLREMPEVDILNLEKGIGGECLSITLMTCMETAQKYGQEILQCIQRHSGHESKQFTPESKRNHSFLSIDIGGKKIIFDPPCKQIQRYNDGCYTIHRTFSAVQDINTYEDMHKNRILYSRIGKGTLDYEKSYMQYEQCTIQMLGYITDVPVFLGFGICQFNGTHITPIVTIYDQHGIEQGGYFYDQYDKCISRLNEPIKQYGEILHHTITSILKDFKERKVLQIQ